METEGCSSIDRLCLFVFFVEQGEFWRRSSCRYVVISFFISNRLGIESSDSLPLTPTDQLDCFHFFFIPSQMVRPIFPSERDDGERERERERKKIKETEREPKSRNDVLICRRPLALVAGLFSDKSHVERPRDDADFSFIHRRYPSKSFTTPFVGSSPLSLSLSLFFFFLCLSGSPIFLLFFYPPRKQGTTVHPTARVLRFGAKCVSVSVCV